MILSGKQVEDLLEALLDSFDQPSMEIFLLTRLEKKLDELVEPAGFRYRIFKLIDVADREGWVLRLVREAHKVRQHKPLLTAFVQSLTLAAPAQPADPFAVSFLYGAKEMSFVNRHDLRSILRALDSGTARIAVIDGPAGSGRSYSFNLICYISEITGRFKPVWIDLTQAAGPDYGPDRLAKRIALQMSVELPPDDLLKRRSQATQWATELSDYLVGKAHAASGEWWIVLDGVLQGNLPPETLHFIHGLAQGALLAPSLRVVLLSYRRELLPTNVLGRSVDEIIAPLQGLDLHEFFERLLQAHATELEDGAVQLAVEWIGDQVAPPYSGDSLVQLPALVHEAADILLS